MKEACVVITKQSSSTVVKSSLERPYANLVEKSIFSLIKYAHVHFFSINDFNENSYFKIDYISLKKKTKTKYCKLKF